MKEFFQIASQRIASKSPKFFLQLRKFTTWLGGILLSTLTANSFISGLGFTIPSKAINVIGYAIVFCGAVAGTTFLSSTDSSLTNQ